MSCESLTCLKDHIQNPSTLECVDKNSILGMWILKLQSEAHAKSSGTHLESSHTSLNYYNKDKEELHLHIKEEFQDINDKLEIFNNKDEEKIHIMQDISNELNEMRNELKNMSNLCKSFDTSVLKNLENIEKQNYQMNVLQLEVMEMKELLYKSLGEEKLDLNKMEEERRVINCLKDEYGISSSSEKSNPINEKIKSFLKYVRSNVEKGKKTNVSKELIKMYFQ